MNTSILFNDNWVFHDGEIETPVPEMKGPIYTQAKTERYRSGAAAFYYLDAPDDYGSRAQVPFPRMLATERWEHVTLPHDYIITQEPKQSGNNALGFFDYHPAWYRKHFTPDASVAGKRVVLYFEGVTDRCEVYLNGCPLYENHSGFIPFEVDLTDTIRPGEENVLAVHVIPGQAEGWWYAGGGIYRNVRFEVSEKLAVERYGVYIAPRKQSETVWELPVEVEVRNNSFSPSPFSVTTEIFAPDGGKVAELTANGNVTARESTKVTMTGTIASPALWDIDTPNLYRAVTTVSADGETLDKNETVFGFRSFSFSANGFFLNGRKIFLKGVCGHGDCGLTGKAVPDNIHRYKVKMIREMGANAYRCSHYPQAEILMDEFDRAGILVMDETRWFSSAPDGVAQLKTLIRRDRNHPSVIFWSIGNEEPYFIRPEGKRIARSLRAEVEKLDATRPVIIANDRSLLDCQIYDDEELLGVNYHLRDIDALHEKYPDRAILSTECCATGTTRGWYDDACPERGYLSSYDQTMNDWFHSRENTWQIFMERPWIIGCFQWIAFEHRGEAMWPRICSQSGAIDLYLIRKDAFWQNQSHWSDKPMIHLLPHWNQNDRMGETIPVWAYTNCEEAELFLDEKSLGRKVVSQYTHVVWDVPFTPGKLTVVGYNGGKEIVRDEKETTGLPHAIRFCLNNPEDAVAGTKNLLLFTCTLADEEGREVPDGSALIRFRTSGAGRIVATGSDVCDHTPVNLPIRRMRAGALTVAVEVGNTPGPLRLSAEADNLLPGCIKVDIH